MFKSLVVYNIPHNAVLLSMLQPLNTLLEATTSLMKYTSHNRLGLAHNRPGIHSPAFGTATGTGATAVLTALLQL
jgi:hypothetical protein